MSELDIPTASYEKNNHDAVATLAEQLTADALAELRASEEERTADWQEEGYAVPRTYLGLDGNPVTVAERTVAAEPSTDPVDVDWRVRLSDGQTVEIVVPPALQDAKYWDLHGRRDPEVIYDINREDGDLSPQLQLLVATFGSRLSERRMDMGEAQQHHTLEASSRPIGYSLGDVEREMQRPVESQESIGSLPGSQATEQRKIDIFKIPSLHNRS